MSLQLWVILPLSSNFLKLFNLCIYLFELGVNIIKVDNFLAAHSGPSRKVIQRLSIFDVLLILFSCEPIRLTVCLYKQFEFGQLVVFLRLGIEVCNVEGSIDVAYLDAILFFEHLLDLSFYFVRCIILKLHVHAHQTVV